MNDDVQSLVARREKARRAKQFDAADELRRRIREMGYEVTDTRNGPVLSSRPADSPSASRERSGEVEGVLQTPARFDISVQWLVESWPQDIVRGVTSFARYGGSLSVQHVIVEPVGFSESPWPSDADVVRVDPDAGWASARNAGLRRAAGRIVVLVDGSIEARGDVFSPLAESLEDPTVGVTGPFGLVTEDLREFRESDGLDVDAIAGHLMAFRRKRLEGGLRFDEKFTFYRNADIDLCFQIKAMGLRATVTPVPVVRHEHRTWTHTPEPERRRLSKRNFYRFLDRWRDRDDLLTHRSLDE